MANYGFIDKRELKEITDKGLQEVELVNVLTPDYDYLGIIPGSKKIPVRDLVSRQAELDKSKEMIVYCASADCHASRDAAEKLAEQGFRVRAYEGGLREWKEAGYPIKGESPKNQNQSQAA